MKKAIFLILMTFSISAAFSQCTIETEENTPGYENEFPGWRYMVEGEYTICADPGPLPGFAIVTVTSITGTLLLFDIVTGNYAIKTGVPGTPIIWSGSLPIIGAEPLRGCVLMTSLGFLIPLDQFTTKDLKNLKFQPVEYEWA